MKSLGIEKEIVWLNKRGLTNRAIAKELGCHHNTVGYWLNKSSLKSNGCCRVPLDRVDEHRIRCSKCKKIKEDSEFLYNRKGKKYEYQFTYCLECRRKQLNANLNSSVEKFLSNKVNRTRLRAKKLNVPFDLTKEFFIKLFEKQEGRCFYTGEKLVCIAGDGKHRNALSVDRIDCGRGYLIDNVVFCTNQVNTSKSDLPLSKIKVWMPRWYSKIIKEFPHYLQQ